MMSAPNSIDQAKPQLERDQDPAQDPQDPTPVCDICFDPVSRLDVYPLPCKCHFTMCWGCVHLQHQVNGNGNGNGKPSRCPCCRAPTRYEYRNQIMRENYQMIHVPKKKGLVYYPEREIDFIDNRGNYQPELMKLEDVVVAVNYLLQVDVKSTCLTALRRHPSMKGEQIPVWARKRARSTRFRHGLDKLYRTLQSL